METACTSPFQSEKDQRIQKRQQKRWLWGLGTMCCQSWRHHRRVCAESSACYGYPTEHGAKEYSARWNYCCQGYAAWLLFPGWECWDYRCIKEPSLAYAVAVELCEKVQPRLRVHLDSSKQELCFSSSRGQEQSRRELDNWPWWLHWRRCMGPRWGCCRLWTARRYFMYVSLWSRCHLPRILDGHPWQVDTLQWEPAPFYSAISGRSL